MHSSLNNFLNIELENDISIITLNDGINHTYCSKIKWEKDNYSPISTAQLIMPYSTDIEQYWTKYSGPVIIHANLNSVQNKKKEIITENSEKISLNLKKVKEILIKEEKDPNTNKIKKIRFQNDEYNYSFIGKISRFKQVGKTFIIYLEDLGWKFMQKVPKEFRDTYIANQRLDDAFQAICEFMGVEFAYSIEDLSQYNFAGDGYSIEKDGEIIENVPSLLREWGKQKDDEEKEKEENEDEMMANALKNNQAFEKTGLIEYEDKIQNQQLTNYTTNQTLNSSVTNNEKETEQNNENKEENTANDKMIQYQEEFDEKIKDLFIGNTLYNSNISDPVLNYNWITITPKAPASTLVNSLSSTTNNNINSNNNTSNNKDNSNNNLTNT